MFSIRLARNFIISLCVFFICNVGYAFYSQKASNKTRLVPLIDKSSLEAQIQAGRQVIFVDAREQAEFEEERIPGAINITLRDVPRYAPLIQENTDLVIAYCLKDFRGYEVAKALQEQGIRNVHTMAEFGLNGWKRNALPTEGKRVNTGAK